jgi:hypothetical protein
VVPSPLTRVVKGGGAAGLALLVLEPAAFVVLTHLGGDDVEDSAAEVAQLAGREGRGVLDEDLFGLGADVGGDVVGEVVQRAGDDVGLRGRHVAGGEPGSEHRPAAVEGPCEREVAAGGAAVDARLASAPGRDVPIAGLFGDLVGDGHEPEPGGVHPRGQAGELLQGFGLLGRGEVEQLDGVGLVQGG